MYRASQVKMETKKKQLKSRKSTEDCLDNGTTTKVFIVYLFVMLVVVIAWLVGLYGLSFLWVFAMIGALFYIWQSQLTKIVQRHLFSEANKLHRKRALRQSETAEWLNFLVNRWWVFSSSTIESLVKKHLDERLIDVKPSFLESMELKVFEFGEQTPSVKHIRVFELQGSKGAAVPATWMSVGQPPSGLNKVSEFDMVIEADVDIHCPHFSMVFQTKVGNKRLNIPFDIAVEDLHIAGTIQLMLKMSMEVPFPHIKDSTVSFIETPRVLFSVKLLKILHMMEMPLIKSWLHSQIMEGFTKAMVDPSKLSFRVASTGPVISTRRDQVVNKTAEGVITIQISGVPVSGGKASDDIKYTVLRVGDSKRQTHEVHSTEKWDDICTFFVYNYNKDKLIVKNKCKRLLTSTNLETKELQLASFPFEVHGSYDTNIDWEDGTSVTLKMTYTSLQPINLERPISTPLSCRSGVMYVHAHSAANVLASDRGGTSDPYCVVFCDRRRVLTTPFVPRTRMPNWDSSMEFFVSDYTQTALSFFVFDWDGTSAINDDFLGCAHCKLSEETPSLVHHVLTLGSNDKSKAGFTVDESYGTITVSIVFRPVTSVAKSELYRPTFEGSSKNYLYKEDKVSPSSAAQRLSTAKKSEIEEYLNEKILVELNVIQAKELAAMDRNGYSDPFYVVKVKDKTVHKSAVKKKTLFPVWNESATFELPSEQEDVEINIYDKDIVTKDFIGKIRLTLDKLKEVSLKETAEWFALERTKTGHIQLSCVVTCSSSEAKGGKKTGSTRTSSGNNDEVFEVSRKDDSLSHTIITESPTHESEITKSHSKSLAQNNNRNTVPQVSDNEVQSLPERSARKSSPASNISGGRGRSSHHSNKSPQRSATPEQWITVKHQNDSIASPSKIETSAVVRASPTQKSTENRKPLYKKRLMQRLPGIESPLAQSTPHSKSSDSQNANSNSRNASSKMRRTVSDINVNNVQLNAESDSGISTLHKNSSEMKPSESINSFAVFNQDNISYERSDSGSEKYYSVSGRILRARGFDYVNDPVYCKVRLDCPGQKKRLFSGIRVIAKSPIINPVTPEFKTDFEVDRGQGVPVESALIFDIKTANKYHVATKGFNLNYLFTDIEVGERTRKWLYLASGIELQVELYHGKPNPASLKKKSKLSPRWSFNKKDVH